MTTSIAQCSTCRFVCGCECQCQCGCSRTIHFKTQPQPPLDIPGGIGASNSCWIEVNATKH